LTSECGNYRKNSQTLNKNEKVTNGVDNYSSKLRSNESLPNITLKAPIIAKISMVESSVLVSTLRSIDLLFEKLCPDSVDY